jgi:superfamily II DNA or RNA helicase
MNLPTTTQANSRHAAVDHRRRNRRRTDGLAGAAGILWADVAMDEEARRFDVELLADILANQRQCLAALATGAGLRFMSMLDARQMIRQGLTAGAFALRLRY